MDTYDHAIAADLMQASAVIATVVYEAANRKEMLPRRELPKAEAQAVMPIVRNRARTSSYSTGWFADQVSNYRRVVSFAQLPQGRGKREIVNIG